MNPRREYPHVVRTRAQEKRQFLVMVGCFFVFGAVFVTAAGVLMVVLRALGVVLPPVATATVTADASAPRAPPLASFTVTFHESSPVAEGSYALEIKPDKTLVCTHHGATTSTKTCELELARLEAIVASPDFAAAAKPSGAEIGDVPTFDIHVESTTVNVDARGFVASMQEYTTPAPMTAAIAELETLCELTKAPTVKSFDVVYTRIEQGGTAGSKETAEVHSDGATSLTDAFSSPLRKGKADAIELAPLSRLLARPELAALGHAYTDSPPTLRMPEVDYDITISKTTTLKGVFYEKTPPIIDAIASETLRVAGASQ